MAGQQQQKVGFLVTLSVTLSRLEAGAVGSGVSDAEDGAIGPVINDVVLETRVLVSRRLEDKNESLGLALGS